MRWDNSSTANVTAVHPRQQSAGSVRYHDLRFERARSRRRAPAVRVTFPANLRPGYCRTTTSAGSSTRTLDANDCGTRTKTRNGSVASISKSAWAAVPAPAFTRLPTSMRRWVTAPSKASARANDTRSSSCRTASRCARMSAFAAATLPSDTVAWVFAWSMVLLVSPAFCRRDRPAALRRDERTCAFASAWTSTTSATARRAPGRAADRGRQCPRSAMNGPVRMISNVDVPLPHVSRGARVDQPLVGDESPGQGQVAAGTSAVAVTTAREAPAPSSPHARRAPARSAG